MVRAILLLLVTAVLACAATIRLYLKDGDYQLVREYSVQGDRVRYYSVERGDWEEIPLELVDLKKTQSESKMREESVKQEAAAIAEEEAAERALQKEIERIPVEPGAYLIAGPDLKTMKPAESKMVTNKRRSILKAVTPIPLVSGKATLEVDGEHSANVINTATPEFYIRLSAEQRFGIVRMGQKKDARILQKLDIMPVTNQIFEEQDDVEVFRQQVGDGLYKIWPMKPLAPGEYAVVEYTPSGDTGQLNIQAWDFGYHSGAPAPSTPAAPQNKRNQKRKK